MKDSTRFDEDLPTATLTIEAAEAVRAEFTGSCLDAAQMIVEIAQGNGAGHSRLEFDAAKYVIEYALGKPGVEGATDPWEKLLTAVNAGQSGSEGAAPLVGEAVVMQLKPPLEDD